MTNRKKIDGRKLVDLLWEIADLPSRPVENIFDGTAIAFTVDSANLVATIAELASANKELAEVMMDTRVVSTEQTHDNQTIVKFHYTVWPDGFKGYGDEQFDDDDESDEEDDNDDQVL